MKSKSYLLTLLLAIAARIGTAQPAVEWTGGQTDFGEDGPFTLGWRFRVSSISDIEVTALGAYDRGGNGLATNHTIAIWPVSGGTPLVVAIVPAGSGAILEGHFRYVNVTPVRLFKDTEYVIGGSDYGVGRDDYAYFVQSFSTSAGVVWLAPREIATLTGGLAFPTKEQSADTIGIALFGGNFKFTSVTSIPYSTIRCSEVEVCWTSEANKQYQVQYRSSLTTNLWQDLGRPVQGTGTNNGISDPIPRGQPQRFYRILLLP